MSLIWSYGPSLFVCHALQFVGGKQWAPGPDCDAASSSWRVYLVDITAVLMASEDDGGAVENWRRMPMDSINHGTLAVVRGAVDACSKSGKIPGSLRLITIIHSPYCEKVRFLGGALAPPFCFLSLTQAVVVVAGSMGA